MKPFKFKVQFLSYSCSQSVEPGHPKDLLSASDNCHRHSSLKRGDATSSQISIRILKSIQMSAAPCLCLKAQEEFPFAVTSAFWTLGAPYVTSSPCVSCVMFAFV